MIRLDDGRIILRVAATGQGRLSATVEQGGALRDRMGVNLPARRMRVPALTEQDRVDLTFGLSIGVDYVALSFVKRADDLLQLRAICEAAGRPTPLIAKIETPEAVENLVEIVAAADAVMVARGDLGVELRPEDRPGDSKGDHRHLPPGAETGDRGDRDAAIDGRVDASDPRRGQRRRVGGL